tara:strand:- start:1192 stop:2151 length:960 start_codon:yes stop_codon:yes gene_type:complete
MFYKKICPEAFKLENISSDILKMNENIAKLITNMPSSHEIPFEILRKIRAEGGSLLPDQPKSDLAVNKVIEFNNTTVSVREFSHISPKFIYLHIHGGGFCLGSSDAQDHELERISKELECVAISIDYRLAPEHPYPAAIDDCEAVALWLVQESKNEYGVDQIVIGGESAGAQLCVATLLRLKEKKLQHLFKAANLIFGTYDARPVPSEEHGKGKPLLLSNEMMQKFEDNYLQNNEDRTDPDVSPIFGDFKDMPPAIFTVGTNDLLLDHSISMYSRWQVHGNNAEIILVPGADHAFIAFPCKSSSAVWDELNKFIAKQIK